MLRAIAVFIVALTISVLNVEAATVTSVTMSHGVAEPNWVPVDIATQFAPDTPDVHAVLAMEDAEAGTTIVVSWISVDAINVPDYEIDSTEHRIESNGPARAHFSMTRPTYGWPVGNYRLEVRIDGELATIKTFSVVSSSPGTASSSSPNAMRQPSASGGLVEESAAPAGRFAGQYVSTDGDVTMTVRMDQDAQGEVTGSLSSTAGAEFILEGMVVEDRVAGGCYNDEMGVFFEAALIDEQLYFYMIEPGADGEPNYYSATEFIFARTDAADMAPTASGRRLPPMRDSRQASAGAFQDDPVTAYFDMLDFVRRETWGRPISTPLSDRQYARTLLQESLPEMDYESRRSIEQLPSTWAKLQERWDRATEDQKVAQRGYWYDWLLSPTVIFPPPPQYQTYQSSGGGVVIYYPQGWIFAEAEDGEVGYAFFAPPEATATWTEILNSTVTPDGALFALVPLDQQARSLPSFADAARYYASQLGIFAGMGIRETNVLPLDNGAIITFVGRFAGESQERFFWVGLVRFGSEHVIVGRLGGSIGNAETLVPLFYNMVTHMELSPPIQYGSVGGSAEYADAMTGAMAGAAWNSVQSPSFSGQEFIP